MDGIVTFVSCVNILVLLNVATIVDSFKTSLLKFGNELPTNHFKTFVGISFELCRHECKARKTCRTIQYARHHHVCMLMSDDSLNVALVRNPKYIVTEKRFWTEASLSAVCDGCSDEEVCELNGATHTCTTQECPIISLMGIGSLTGNLMGTGDKVLVERECYSMRKGQRSNVRVYYTCLANGNWHASKEVACASSYEDNIHYEGCVRDSKERILDHKVFTQRTIEKCAVYCFNRNNIYFGLQNGNACHCGNTINYNHGPSTGCNKPCQDDSSVTCGGGWALQLYTYIAI